MKYRFPILICALLLAIAGVFWIQSQIDSASSSVAKPNCNRVRQCLNADRAWPPGMEFCPTILVPEIIRSRSKDGKWGYSMSFGECSKDTVIAQKFDVAEKFGNNGLAKVSQDGKWGYVNIKGEEVIPIRFDEVGDFDSGLVPVRENSIWGYYDAQGHKAVPPLYEAVSGVWRNERSAVQLRGEWGYVNTRGDEVVKPRFNKVTEFQDGLAKVELNQKWGVIDDKGNFVIEPTFDAIFSTAYPGLLLVVVNRKYGYFDKGKEIILPRLVKPVKAKYDEISGNVKVVLNAAALVPAGNAAPGDPKVSTGAWYFLDSPNEKLRFDEDGKAQLWRNGEWFYVSQNGVLVRQ